MRTLALYEVAMERLEPHIHRQSDGTFHLDVTDGREIMVDPVVFADLAKSLEITNNMIRNGDLDPSTVDDSFFK